MAANQMTDVAKPGSNAYKIGPLDVLEISVFKVPDLSKTVQVADQGTINLPLVGEIPAAGRTARDVEQELTEKLGKKYLQNPQVTVFVKEYNSQRVTVEGAVEKPGVFPIQGRMTLIQALALAQGLDANSDSSVIIFRDVASKRTAARFDVAAIRGGNADDPLLQAGDLVVAGNSATKEAFNNLIKALPIASLFGAL
jgi:polysaccharide biosynthesis/export protein